MIKEQSSDSHQNWFLFDDRNIINDVKDRNAQKLFTSRFNRPMDYCNWPLAKVHEDENALGRNWKLKHLFVFFRHGQRASAKPMAETKYQYYINCSLRQFLSFKIHDWKEFINSLDKSNVPSTNFDMKGICKESQLTLLGILQMFIVGSRLNKAYHNFLKLNSPTIFSTPYQRTMLSSQIIQYQLMKNIEGDEHSSKIQESQSLVFCRPNSNITCQCPSLRFFYSKYNRYKSHQINQNVKCLSVISKFNSIFSLTSLNDYSISSLSNLFDIVSTALCASNLDEIGKSNVFCWPSKKAIINQEPWSFYKSVDENENESGTISKDNQTTNTKSGPCIPLKLIIDLWNCVDDITEKVNSYQYFHKYSKLAVFPILNEIVSSVMIKTPQTSIKNGEKLENKVANHFIYVGHDHTLRYLLSALDFKNSMDRSIYNFINLWPGFASRLVIEVFEKTSQEEQKFRLLYNGIIITSSLKFCPSNEEECDFRLLSKYLYSREYWNYDLFTSTRYSQECIAV